MTRTVAESFTLTHAKYLASKVTTDMWRCRQLYGQPSETEINNYGTELALRLRDGFVSKYEFGFQIEDERLLSWRYTVVNGDLTATDDRPGRIVSEVDVSKARFFNQLTTSSKWDNLPDDEKEKWEAFYPFRRQTKAGPKDGRGYWQRDLQYSSNGTLMSRETFRPY
ncbi:MAG: hypothetical protein KGJ95_10350 [Candidatus Omnitrophica bacterium]|nr:hypothetical protein [Candidatus Omnitrophota bacterium]